MVKVKSSKVKAQMLKRKQISSLRGGVADVATCPELTRSYKNLL